MITKKELLYGLKAAEKLNLLIAVSFCCNEKMQLLSGEKLSDVILEIEKYEPLFIGINCVSRKIAENAVAYLHSITKLPICVYAQGDGEPNPDQGWKFNEVKSVDAYLKSARKWLRNGAIIIGGCCGTTPLHIYKLKQLIKPSI